MLLAALSLLSSTALVPRTAPYVSRRAALLSLPTLSLWPHAAAAILGLGGDDGPQGEFREIVFTRQRLEELGGKLERKELRGDVPDDAIVVLQTLTIQFGGTTKLLEKTTAAMPLLDAADAAQARELSVALTKELDNVRQGCRERSATMQLDGTRAAGKALSQYLAVAGKRYSLPAESEDLSYSKDPEKFASQYFGIFSCEGQGLERVKGSNTCKDPPSKASNVNPFPTKQLLDFDFLTGEKLPK